jgi:prepilin-type N-terminal cleavage/methylation domain-containing protein
VVKKAFTLIELIFAIVVISIVLLSLPSLTQATYDSSEGSLAQEAIFIASAKIAQISTYHWDENSVDNNVLLSTAKVVDVAGGNSAYAREGTSTQRKGHLKQDRHRKFHDNAIATKSVAGIIVDNAANNTLDIDDEVGSASLDNAAISNLGYKQTYTMNIAVNYVSDLGTPSNNMNFNFSDTSSGESNLKMIEVSVSNASEVITTLRAYSANIGEIDYHSKVY